MLGVSRATIYRYLTGEEVGAISAPSLDRGDSLVGCRTTSGCKSKPVASRSAILRLEVTGGHMCLEVLPGAGGPGGDFPVAGQRIDTDTEILHRPGEYERGAAQLSLADGLFVKLPSASTR